MLANGLSPDKAAVLTQRIAWGNNRLLYHVPGEIKGNMYALENLWTRSGCLNILFSRYYLKWYEIRYPRGYQKACDEPGEV